MTRFPFTAALAAIAVLGLVACSPPSPSPSPSPIETPDSGGTVAFSADDANVEIVEGWAEGVIPTDDFGPDGGVVTQVGPGRYALSFETAACGPIELDGAQDPFLQGGIRYSFALIAAGDDCDDAVWTLVFDGQDGQLPNSWFAVEVGIQGVDQYAGQLAAAP